MLSRAPEHIAVLGFQPRIRRVAGVEPEAGISLMSTHPTNKIRNWPCLTNFTTCQSRIDLVGSFSFVSDLFVACEQHPCM